MIFKEDFDKEVEKCEAAAHIEEEITDPTLIEIDRLFGVADHLSINHSQKHHNTLLYMSIITATIVLCFLIYDEVEQHLMIFAIMFLIIALYYLYKRSQKESFHEKYIDYRVVAETLRVKYYLMKSGTEQSVSELLPWFTDIRIPMIKEILSELPKTSATNELIKECWVIDQKNYHKNAYKDAKSKKQRNDRWEKIALYATVSVYGFTLIFEICMLFSPANTDTANQIRTILKIAVGLSSVVTILLANYYGKMSLSSKSQEHLRMFWLYERIENEMETKGESDEIIIYLAKQFLIENAIWYSHQKKNEADFVVE